MNNITRIGIGIVLVALFAVPLLLVSDSIDAENPSGLSLTIFQTDLMADASSAPVTVFTSETGSTIDIVANPGDAFGQGDVPAGTYKRIKFTVQNRILYSGVNPCGGAPIVDQPLDIDSTQAPDAQVELFFATSEDGGNSGWYSNGTSASPFLMQNAVLVEGGATTTLTLIFNTANTLQCIGGASELFPPTMNAINYIEEATACSIAGDYWFAHFNVHAGHYDESGDPMSPTMDALFQNTGVVAGWGTVSFNADGTWGVSTATAETGGMAEHRHNLISYDPLSGDEGYFNPVPGPAALGTYTLAGSHLIMYFPEGGYIEGGFTDDCNTIVGANIATTEETDLIYAVRKRTSTGSNMFVNKKYVSISPSFNLHYDPLDSDRTDYFNFQADLMVATWLDASTMRGLEWGPSNEVNPVYTGPALTGMTSWGPRETAYDNSMTGAFTFSDEGLVTLPTLPVNNFIALGAGGSAVYGGDIPDPIGDPVSLTDDDSHRLAAGFFMEAASSPVLADLAGTWTLAMYNAGLEARGDVDSDGEPWGDGDEGVEFGLTYGSIIIDASGNGTYSFTEKDSLSGNIESSTGNVTISAPAVECYQLGTPVTDATCATGVQIPVFHVIEGGQLVARIVLDNSKKVITVWSPFEANDTPEHETCGFQTGAAPLPCAGAANHFSVGVGVRTQ